MDRQRNYVSTAVIAILIIGVAVALCWVLINRQWVYDLLRGNSYEPIGEMSRIREDLALTDRGRFLFNAAQPALQGRDSFNSMCGTGDNETAVLGCYTNGNIYVYNITEEELDGIRELTTAHELLHVVWARMNDDEKEALSKSLEKVRVDNGFLQKELETYDTSEREEELYVRAGTEVANLPTDLENHYAEVFSNQDLVVDFYNSYIAVFRGIEAEMNDLKARMEVLSAEINTKTEEYKQGVDQLEMEIDDFNACARTIGCFVTEEEFGARRIELIGKQNALEALYDEINSDVEEYNAMVDEYNADVMRGDQLNQMINSNSKINEIQ